MDIDNFILYIHNNLFIFINDNKIILLLFILIIFYFINLNDNIIKKTIKLFDSNIFKLIIFIIIIFLSISNIILGLGLGIIILVCIQLITTLKFKKEINNNFT